MITDRRDPAFDDRLYCPSCLHLIDEDEIKAMGPDPMTASCPHCGDFIMRTLRHDQMREEESIRRVDAEDRERAQEWL